MRKFASFIPFYYFANWHIKIWNQISLISLQYVLHLWLEFWLPIRGRKPQNINIAKPDVMKNILRCIVYILPFYLVVKVRGYIVFRRSWGIIQWFKSVLGEILTTRGNIIIYLTTYSMQSATKDLSFITNKYLFFVIEKFQEICFLYLLFITRWNTWRCPGF